MPRRWSPRFPFAARFRNNFGKAFRSADDATATMTTTPTNSRTRAARRRMYDAVRLEALEQRQLFTTLFSNEVFQFQDASRHIVQIQLGPNTTAEFIGSSIDENNGVTLNDLPGKITTSPITARNGLELLGGVGGAKGVQLIGLDTIPPQFESLDLPSGDLELTALASRNNGDTYTLNETEINITPTTTAKVLQLIQLDPTTGIGTVIEPALLDGAVFDKVISADFDPTNDNLLYVAVHFTPPANSTELAGPRLIRIDVTNSNAVTLLPGNFNNTEDNATEINAIAFDATGQLWAIAKRTLDEGSGDTATTTDVTRLYRVNSNFASLIGTTTRLQNDSGSTIILDGEDVGSQISAFDFVPGDTGFFFATMTGPATTGQGSAAGGKLLHVRVVQGGNSIATDFGPLPDPSDTRTPKRGENIQAVAWNPTAHNPFTGGTGVLIGTDVETDELVAIDIRNRFPASDLFSIYVSQADQTSYITVSNVTIDKDGKATYTPFTGDVGQVRINNAKDGKPVLVTPDTNTGGVYLGARTKHLAAAADAGDDKKPITSAAVTSSFGVLPGTFSTITSGLIVADGLDLGAFLFAGAVTGQVIVPGSLGLFYAGWLLTGQTQGQFFGSAPEIPANFAVGGDLRELIVKGSVGTDVDTGGTQPVYVTGFDLSVGGAVGEIVTQNAWIGTADIAHGDIDSPIVLHQQEVETYGAKGLEAGLFATAQLSDAAFGNDTQATAQHLGSIATTSATPNDVLVDGIVQRSQAVVDPVDYYSVALLAGQTVTISVAPNFAKDQFANVINVQLLVFDPDGRLIASDYSGTLHGPFRVTADRPGDYKVAVTLFGTDLPSDITTSTTTLATGFSEYTLSIANVGNLGLGALVVKNNYFDNGGAPDGLHVENGDLGSISVGGSLLSNATSLFDPFDPGFGLAVDGGNLRSVVGGTIGQLANGFFGDGPSLFVAGSVGLLHTTTGILVVNDEFDPDGGVAPPAIGGSFQVIDSAANLFGNLFANVGIGVIRAGEIVAQNAHSYFRVNADNVGFDGTIDLIDVAGDLGTLSAGGPVVDTGNGGNVRYIHAGGAVFRDEFFGGGAPSEQTFNPGEAVSINDDSGSHITLTPTGNETTTVDPNDPLATPVTTINSVLTISTYPIRGSGGVVLLKVTSTGSVNISSSGDSGASTAEVTEVDVQGQGAPVITTVDDTTDVPTLSLDPASTADLSVNITGSAAVDVFDIIGGAFNRISNDTKGEIVNLHVGSIGELTANTLGLARSSIPGLAVLPTAVVSDVLPFEDQRIGIVSGDIVLARSRRALGNFIVSGSIQQLLPNYDGVDTAGVFEGIAGPIFTSADMNFVNIGEGLAPGGSGASFKSGLFANGVIRRVVNQGEGSDVRGVIVSTIPDGIGTISLKDGALIHAEVAVVTNFRMASPFPVVRSTPSAGDAVNNPETFDIGSISLSGNGGIIGSEIVAADIGSVKVSGGGFGILNSSFTVLGDGTFKSVSADGYGIRGTTFHGGTQFGTLEAVGNGHTVSTASFTPSVRQSETTFIDPFFNDVPTSLTDLHAFLGTSAAAPIIVGVTDSGVIENVVATGQGDLKSVRAWSIRTRGTNAAPQPSSFYPTQLNFANSIGSIRTSGPIDGLSLTTGKLKEFKPAGDVARLGIQVAGKISSVKLPGSLSGDSFIRATGRNGRISEVRVRGNLDGDVSATGVIKKLEVDGAINGTVNITGLSQKKKVIEQLILGGAVANGSLTINGSAGTIKAKGNLGNTGDLLIVNGTLDKLDVRGNLFSNVTIHGKLKSAKIRGSMIAGATLHVDNVLQSIKISTDFQAGATIEALEVRKKKVKGLDLGTVVLL